MERRRAAGALLALAACILCTAAAPTASNHTALNLYDGESEGCYYNFQHYGESDRIMTNEPCLNCTCHNRMLMCYLRVCPFTKPIGQDCTVEKRADQCCPIVTCPDVPVDLLTLTSTTSPAEYGATGVGKLDKYGCSINGKYFPEGSKVPPTPNKPCEHCYCIRNMTTCVMQECTLHVDGCTPIYHKDVCCPVRYSCDHPEDEILLLDDKTTTVRPTPGFLLTTTTNSPVTGFTQDCVHDDQIFSDGALIKTEKACEHCYCMKGDIVCVVQECGTPMENEGKNCTSLPPREGQCCPDTYICEGDELNTEYPMDLTTDSIIEDLTTLSPPRRVDVEGSGYRKEPDNIALIESHQTELTHEGSGDIHEAEHTTDLNDVFTTEDNTNYVYSTVPSFEHGDKDVSGQYTTAIPSDETPSSTDLDDHKKATTLSNIHKEIGQEENVALNKIESTTSSVTSYDHKLETSLSEDEAVTEKEKIKEPEDIVSRTTISSIPEEKEATTASEPYEETIVTDAFTSHYDKHISSTIPPILEDEGITTESDREQQTISTEHVEEHSFIPGLPTASTTSAPFLEEVEGIQTGTYGQHDVTDQITESDIYDSTKDKAESITTPSDEDDENLININNHKDYPVVTESNATPTMESHDEFAYTTTIVPSIEEVEKTSIKIPENLVTSKPSEETYVEAQIVLTSTHQPATKEIEAINESHKESLVTTQVVEASEPQKADDEPGKSQTDKYEQTTDKEINDYHADVITTSSSVFINQDEESTKTSKDSESVTTEAAENVITDDVATTIPTSVPIYDDHLTTMENKDTIIPQENDSFSSTKPNDIEDGKKTITPEVSHDDSLDKHSDQETYEPQKPTPTNAPISEEVEIATTEFVKDQDFATAGVMEQDSLKPGDFVPSTSSTPFLEEIEKLTTEVSQGHVVTDIISEKDENKPPKEVTAAGESYPPSEMEDITTFEPDRGLNTIPSGVADVEDSSKTSESTTQTNKLQENDLTSSHTELSDKENQVPDISTTTSSSLPDDTIIKEDKNVATTEPSPRKEDEHHVDIITSHKEPELVSEVSIESIPTTESIDLQETQSSSQPSLQETHKIHENIPHEESTTETRTEYTVTEKEIKPDITEGVATTTQIIPNLPEASTINLGENEIDEDNLLPPGRIPGEGECLLNGVTYKNESAVPSTHKCHSDCKCVSSIIKCSPIICSAPPEYMENCQPTYDSPESCCPTYVCDQFRETLPPMPHIQVSSTALPQQPSPTECRGDQCEIHAEKIHPVVSPELCTDSYCRSEIDKKSDISSCGPHGCTEPSKTPECNNGDCKHILATVPLGTQCENGNCETPSVNLPQVPECKNGRCEGDKMPEIISEPCADEGGCNGSEENVIRDCADETCRRKETSDIIGQPSSCTGSDCKQQSPIEKEIETSTLSEPVEIKTESPEIHISDSITTEKALHHTIVPEIPDIATEMNEFDITISGEKTQQTVPISGLDSHDESISSVTEEEPKLTEFVSTVREFVTESYTKSPQLDNDNVAISTKIPEEYIVETDKDDSTKRPEEDATQNQQINTDVSMIPPGEQTFETSEAHTEPAKYVPDIEENTIKVITDEEIPTNQPITSHEILPTTSKPKLFESEKLTTQTPGHGISEVTESQVTELHEDTSLPETYVTEHEKYTLAPMYDVTKSEVSTQAAIETEQEATEYHTQPKATTFSPTELYVTLKESEEKVTELGIQKVEDEMYTHPKVSATEPQAVDSEYSTQSNIVANLPDVMITQEEHALLTESSGATTDKITYITEVNLNLPESDTTQKPEQEYNIDTELPEKLITETIDFTPEPSIKEQEVQTENELNTSKSSEGSETEKHKETDLESTPSSVVNFDETTRIMISEKTTESSSTANPHKIEEEVFLVTSDHDLSTEPIELSTTASLGPITEKPLEVEQVPMHTEKSETTPLYTEFDTVTLMEHVKLPEKATELPEILSHKKEHSSESPILLESETEKPIGVEDTIQQEESTTNKASSLVTEIPGIDEHQSTIMNEETTDRETLKEKIEQPAPLPETEDSQITDLDKSTEYGQGITELPELHTVKTEETTIITPIETETATDLTEIVSVTKMEDNVDTNVDKEEISTVKAISEYTSSQSYAPEEPEINYTEKVQTKTSVSSTKTLEAITTESSQISMDTSTVVAPEIHDIHTEIVPAIEEEEIYTKAPEIQGYTEIPALVVIEDKDIITEISVEHTEEDLVTKIQDGITEHQELITEVPEIHISTSSIAPEVLHEKIVTESPNINKVFDEAEVTEYQSPVTEFEYSITTEQPEIKEPIKEIEQQPSTDAPKASTDIPTFLDELTASPDLQATAGDPGNTDHEEVTFSSAEPNVTDIESVEVTESVHAVPESSSINSEKPSTPLLQDDFTQHEVTQTVSSEPFTEEPAEESSQIPDFENVEHEDAVANTPKPIDNAGDITQSDYSHTVPQETATEIAEGVELSTEPSLQIASESHDKDELLEPTSAPIYELSETTPYLIELQEHTHKTIQEVTTSSLVEKEITTELIIPENIGGDYTVSKVTTEAYVNKEGEVQGPTKLYEETSTILETPEKSTQSTQFKEDKPIPTTQSAEIDVKKTTMFKDEDLTTQSPTQYTEIAKDSTPELAVTDNMDKTVTTSEKPLQSDLTVEITTQEEINLLSTEKTTIKAEELLTQSPVAVDKITKPDEKPIELPAPLPDLLKPGPSDIQPTDEVPLPDEETHFAPSSSSGYGSEPDYVEEDQAFGPGTCRYGGKVYVSAQQIPRDDPCDFCFCFRSDIICLQQSCPPPIHGCHEEPIQGFCCPRYECPVSMATTLNVTTTTTTTTTTLPPHFPTHSYKGAAQRRGCQIKGHTYKVGEVVRSSSGPCLHCTCGGDGQMKCDPKACTPEPMLRQMIAAAVSAKRRR